MLFLKNSIRFVAWSVCWIALLAKGQESTFPADSVFLYKANDSTVTTVSLQHDTNGVPVFYATHLVTGVCTDGLCRPVDLQIHWDLLGRFQDYVMSPGHPITKFDHEPLTDADHEKLHQLLADTSCLLRDYAVADMIDTTVKVQSGVLDAVTGATSPTFASVTVQGAMYTVYTLWHFVNGPVRGMIRQRTVSLLSDTLMETMLRSDRLDYQQFVYERLSDEQRRQFAPLILNLIGNKDPYIPHFAIDQLTPELLADSVLQLHAVEYLDSVTAPVQNSLLAKLTDVTLHRGSTELLLEAVPAFSANQLANVFALLFNNLPAIQGGASQVLTDLSQQPGKPYSKWVAKLTQRLSFLSEKTTQ